MARTKGSVKKGLYSSPIPVRRNLAVMRCMRYSVIEEKEAEANSMPQQLIDNGAVQVVESSDAESETVSSVALAKPIGPTDLSPLQGSTTDQDMETPDKLKVP